MPRQCQVRKLVDGCLFWERVGSLFHFHQETPISQQHCQIWEWQQQLPQNRCVERRIDVWIPGGSHRALTAMLFKHRDTCPTCITILSQEHAPLLVKPSLYTTMFYHDMPPISITILSQKCKGQGSFELPSIPQHKTNTC